MSDMLKLSCAVELEAAAGDKPRRLNITAYTGGEMSVDFHGPTVVSLAGMSLPSSVPILADHRNELSSIIASGSPVIDKGILSIKATLADSEAARHVTALLTSGTALQASVGAQILSRKFVGKGDSVQANGRSFAASERGLTLVEKSELKEISVVPAGADSNTSVSLAASSKGIGMSDTSTITDPIEAALKAERKRVKTIDKICSGLNLAGGLATELDRLKGQALEGSITIDVLQASALDLVRAGYARPTMNYGPASAVHVTSAQHLSAALLVKAGFAKVAETAYGEHVMEQSKSLHGASLVDLCKASFAIDRRECPSNRDAMLRAGLSTGSMPIALGDSASKILISEYRAAPAAWRSFAKVISAANFKEQSALRPSFLGDLEEVGNSGELKHATFAEEVYVWQLSTFGKILQIGRQQMINDDLGVFNQVLPSMAKSAARTLSGLVATVLLANAGSFFSSDHLNYFEGSGTALSASSLATAIRMLRVMKDAEGNLLDLSPSVLLVPPELENTGRALLNSAEVLRVSTDLLPTGNTMQGVATLVVEPRLSDSAYTGYSTTAWYLFSDPSNAAIVVGFLDGQETPITENFGLDHDINTLSMGWRIYHDFGCALGDYRAAVQAKGIA